MSYEKAPVKLNQPIRSFVCGKDAGSNREPIVANVAETLKMVSKLFGPDKTIINTNLFSRERC